MPNGNRSGEFHASPGGKADAPGTPNVVAMGNADSGGGHAGNGPAGIMVGAAPPGANTSAVAELRRLVEFWRNRLRPVLRIRT